MFINLLIIFMFSNLIIRIDILILHLEKVRQPNDELVLQQKKYSNVYSN
jgi:hypothetical protein